MPAVHSRHELLEEIDAEYKVLGELIDRVPAEAWTTSRVNAGGWSLKDVLAHIADWAERCESNCALGSKSTEMAPPLPGFKWNETRQANHAIYLRRRGHSLVRVLRDFRIGHEALLRLARTMDETDLLAIGKFAWCGPTWSVAKYIRANTAAHYRWASKHFKRWLRQSQTDSESTLKGKWLFGRIRGSILGEPAPQVPPDPLLGLLSPHGGGSGLAGKTGCQNRGCLHSA